MCNHYPTPTIWISSRIPSTHNKAYHYSRLRFIPLSQFGPNAETAHNTKFHELRLKPLNKWSFWDSGDATCSSGCSQEHPELKKKLYIIIKIFYICSVLRTPSNFLIYIYIYIYSTFKQKISPKKIELKSENKK